MKVRYVRPKVGPPLTIEFIPKNCQGRSLYHRWPQKWWDKLRKLVYRRSNYTCEICKKSSEVQCHEVWKFDIKTKTQKLLYLVCICKSCHEAKHFGHAYLNGKMKPAIEQLCKINSWTVEQTLDYIEVCYEIHKKYRGIKFKSKLDLSILSDFITRFQIKERKIRRVKTKTKTKQQKKDERKISKFRGNHNRKPKSR